MSFLTPPDVEPHFDIQRYMGLWHEIARMSTTWYEAGCCDVRANYVALPDGSVRVQNSCLTKDGTQRTSVGKALMYEPGKLTVSFLYLIPPWLMWSNYYVLRTDYQSYALVGTPDRSSLWILARSQHLPPDVYALLENHAQSAGFDTTLLLKTPMLSAVV